MELDDRFKRIGKYKVLSTIHIGGKCEVYKCLDASINRYVALKLLAGSWARDTILIEHFENAARAAQRIDHPNVAHVFDVERTEDLTPYIVMEFVDGPSFADFIKNKIELPYGRIAELFIQVAEGLLAAYHENILHCDVKPANLMLNARDEVKIIDFGIAKVFREALGHQRTIKAIFGTPKYMSPEQCLGKTVDHRSDIYSIGATMYHMLTGQAPYDAETLNEIIAKQNAAPFTPIYIINPRVPNELCDIIHPMLAKDPDERYQTYDHLIDDLKRFQLSRVAKEAGSPMNLSADQRSCLTDKAGRGEGDSSSRLQLQPEDDKSVGAGTWDGRAQTSAPRTGSSTLPVLGSRISEREGQLRQEQAGSRGGATDDMPHLRPVPPLAAEKPTSARLPFILASLAVVIFLALTVLFQHLRTRQQGSEGGGNLLTPIFHALFKPKPLEQKLTKAELYVLRCDQTMARMQKIRDMMRAAIADRGALPQTIQELADAHYLAPDETRDAWGREIVLIRMNADLRSFGEDGEEDTTDDIRLNADGRFYRMPAEYGRLKADQARKNDRGLP
jgi:serine/threonine protein kinase